ncbi:MAG TPA: hypothetical protein VGJ60_20380 [Chloroflexota bacterium]|jgi:hypothetical protein
MPERGLRQRIRGALRTAFPDALVLGWPANSWTGGGWPDLLFWQFPLLIGLEVKQGRRSKPTPLQLARHKALREHHIPVYVVHTPAEAVWIIAHIIERFPMAFDPKLIAELEAALGEEPVQAVGPAPEPEPLPTFEAEYTAPNGVAAEAETLDADAPAPDIQDLTEAIETQTAIEAELDLANAELLLELKRSVDALTMAIYALIRDMADDKEDEVPQTVEAPAPRRGRRPRGA